MAELDIPKKANKILYLFLIALLLFLARAWFLTTQGYDHHAAFARRAQQRTLVQLPQRGTIRDRFGLPLAINQMQYNAAVCYSDLQEIPRIRFEGKEKVYVRRLYIEKLAAMLGNALDISPQDIEDTIYSKASIFPNTPFVIKEGVSEELYYRLRISERNWPGIVMQRSSKRYYPQGKVAADVIGYMGAINDREYLSVAQKLRELGTFLRDFDEGMPTPLPKGFTSATEVKKAYSALKERSYTINDQVGKSGIEAQFDGELKGYIGKKRLEVGMQGTPVRELPNSKAAVSGKRLYLTISAELQRYAEELLAKTELERDRLFSLTGSGYDDIAPPWIKGGAIVAMIPQTGEIVAMASFPRFDPNDFILCGENRDTKIDNVHRWIESETCIANIWDGKRSLFREIGTEEETRMLSWERYLDMTLSRSGSVRRAITKVKTVRAAVDIQREIIRLLDESGLVTMRTLLSSLPTGVCTYIDGIAHIEDKLLFLDLLRLVAPESSFSLTDLETYGALSLSEFRSLSQQMGMRIEAEKRAAKKMFHETIFAQWRADHFADYLKGKRKEEKEAEKYQRPYTDYLQMKERELFAAYWEAHAPTTPFVTFRELKEATWGHYPSLRSDRGRQLLKHLAAAFYPRNGFGFGRSHTYRQATTLGSIFKIVTGYEALMQRHAQGAIDLNPLTIIDEGSPQGAITPTSILGYHTDGRPICRRYNGGHLPRSHAPIGHTTFPLAMQRSSNIYFSLLSTDVLKEPTDLLHAATAFGFGTRTGIDLPYEYGGHLPNDLRDNRTGLYAFAIGQHSLTVTPLQATSMLATLANGGEVLKPLIISQTFGMDNTASPLTAQGHPFDTYLSDIGIHFPLFTEAIIPSFSTEHAIHTKIVRDRIPLPDRVRSYLLDSLDAVVWSKHGSANPYRIRTLYTTPGWHRDYVSLKHQLIGKTSTAERTYRPTLDRERGVFLAKDIWFGGVAFAQAPTRWETPELAVTVYLRYGDWGKEAAPIAAQIAKKWREIATKHFSCLSD